MDAATFQFRYFGWYLPCGQEKNASVTKLRIVSYLPLVGTVIGTIGLYALATNRKELGPSSLLQKCVCCLRCIPTAFSLGIVWLPFDLLATMIRVIAQAVFNGCKKKEEDGFFDLPDK